MNTTSFEVILDRDGCLVYTNVGDSMMPLIHQGQDLLIIEPAKGRLKRLDIPLYKRDSGKYVLHRILKVRDHDYVICGDNRWRCEFGITDRHIIGKLTAIVRDGKTIPMSALKIRIYAHLWCDAFYIRAIVLMSKSVLKRFRHRLFSN